MTDKRREGVFSFRVSDAERETIAAAAAAARKPKTDIVRRAALERAERILDDEQRSVIADNAN